MADQHESGRTETMTPSREDVAKRAYELFEARGAEAGHDLENWLDAERELEQASPKRVSRLDV